MILPIGRHNEDFRIFNYFKGLTPGERRVAEELLCGLTNQQIAMALGIKVKTVKFHLTRIYAKKNVSCDREFLAICIGGLRAG